MKLKAESKKIAGIGSDAVHKRTGKTWDEWFAILDKRGARKMNHTQIAALLFEKLGCSGWWSQMLTVGYEQARGMRERHELPSGFQISRSKTLAVPVATAYKAWVDVKRRGRWLTDSKFTIRTAISNRSLRITWIDGTTNVEVFFIDKGNRKTQITVQHNKLASATAAERKKKYWAEQLERLQEYLLSGGASGAKALAGLLRGHARERRLPRAVRAAVKKEVAGAAASE